MSRQLLPLQKDHNLIGTRSFCCKSFLNLLLFYSSLNPYLIFLLQSINIRFSIFSEIDNFDTGLLIEVWDKGMLWDKTIGYFWEPLQKILQCAELVCKQNLAKPFYYKNQYFSFNALFTNISSLSKETIYTYYSLRLSLSSMNLRMKLLYSVVLEFNQVISVVLIRILENSTTKYRKQCLMQTSNKKVNKLRYAKVLSHLDASCLLLFARKNHFTKLERCIQHFQPFVIVKTDDISISRH